MSRIVREDASKNVTYLIWGPSATTQPDGVIAKWVRKLPSKLRVFLTFATANNPSGLNYFDDIWALESSGRRSKQKVWLSTGFFTVVTSLNFCSSVTIFGLDAKELQCGTAKERDLKVRLYEFSFFLRFCSEKHEHFSSYLHAQILHFQLKFLKKTDFSVSSFNFGDFDLKPVYLASKRKCLNT